MVGGGWVSDHVRSTAQRREAPTALAGELYQARPGRWPLTLSCCIWSAWIETRRRRAIAAT